MSINMSRYILYNFIIIIVIIVNNVKSDILIYRQITNQIVDEYRDLPAKFGGQIPSAGLRVLAVQANPINGCSLIRPPPSNNNETQIKWVAIIERCNCTFEQKIRNAQLSGYDAVIVYNVGSNELEQMSADNDDDIFIPSVFVGERAGNMIKNNYQYVDQYALLINDDLPFNINTHLIIPFSIVVGICFVIMVSFMVIKCVREQRRLRRYRLPNSVLKKIPTIRFTKGDNYDTCAICLDDYIENDKLRVLPCAHAYHCKCIDPWLTKNRRVCPICKRKVFARGEKRSNQNNNNNSRNSQTSIEQQRNRRRSHSSSDSMSDTDVDDTTPLLNPVENTTNHGTFQQQHQRRNINNNNNNSNTTATINQQRINPFDRLLPTSGTGTITDQQLLNSATILINDQNNLTTLSKWERFKNLFKKSINSNNNTNDGDDNIRVDVVVGDRSGLNNSVNVVINADDDDVSLLHATRTPANSSNINNSNNALQRSFIPSSSSSCVFVMPNDKKTTTAASSSNNILNKNLCGSFKSGDDEDEDTDDDEDDGNTKYKNIKRRNTDGNSADSSNLNNSNKFLKKSNSSSSNICDKSNSDNNRKFMKKRQQQSVPFSQSQRKNLSKKTKPADDDDDDVAILNPNNSGQVVAALPNTNFTPSPPTSRRQHYNV